METLEQRMEATKALIGAIWGPSTKADVAIAPEEREEQNWLLAEAIKAYLQAYLDEARE